MRPFERREIEEWSVCCKKSSDLLVVEREGVGMASPVKLGVSGTLKSFTRATLLIVRNRIEYKQCEVILEEYVFVRGEEKGGLQ